MPLLRLAYSALFLIAWIAVYVAWSQIGGQAHLDLQDIRAHGCLRPQTRFRGTQFALDLGHRLAADFS